MRRFILVPFIFARGGRLMPREPKSFVDLTTAERMADGLALTHAGVIVLDETDDPSEEPRLAYHRGEIPYELFAFA